LEGAVSKLFVFNMVSLDGYFEGPNRNIDWHNVDEEFNQFAIEQTSAVSALLFGRVTYELMASYWPTPAAAANDPEIAGLMNRLPKVVFSKSLQEADWNNTRLVRDGIAGEIQALKLAPGGDIALFGSANLMSTLIQLDLVDEYRILVNPIALGTGTPLFQNIHAPLKLRLVKSRPFRSGNVLLCYQPDR
jgi:dihydrofolate reductase